MMTASSSPANYDAMFCLNEHLDYFNEAVAGKHELLSMDFDDIFAVPMTSLVSSTSAPVEITSTHVVPPSPKATQPTEAPISPKPMQLSREQAVVSPTTVTSTSVFTEAPAPVKTPQKPKPISRKRKISDESAAASPSKRSAPIDPADKEDIRRERNRQHAKRSRQRKRELMTTLEQAVQSLKEENARLFEILGLSQQNDSHVVAERRECMDRAANESFIEALQQPQNRVLSNDALTSIRELIESQQP